MATVSEQIQEIYIGLLGRAADKAGLDYWAAEIEAGTITIGQVRANIVEGQAEYAEGLGSMSRVQTVAELYQRLFEREAADNELEYWVNEEGGSVSVDELVLALSNGASAADRLTLDNKTTAASYYTNNTASYDADSAKAAVDSVDGTQASVEASKAATNAGEPAAETAYELTAGTDKGTDFVGTSAADMFTADLSQNAFAGGVSNTLSSADKLDGQGGIDTLKAQIVNEFVGVNGGGYEIDIQPTTTNIEIVELEARDLAGNQNGSPTVTLDAKDMTDIIKIGSSYSDANLVIENLTTLTSTRDLADARNTEELTIVMDHTDSMNSDNDASDLTVYFDEDYLLSGSQKSGSTLTINMINTLNNKLAENGGTASLIEGFETVAFSVGTTDISVDVTDLELSEVKAAIEAALDAAGITTVSVDTYKEPAYFATNIYYEDTGTTYSAGSRAGDDYTAFKLSNSGPEELIEGGFTLADGARDGSLAYSQDDSESSIQDDAVAINVELEKVGRDGSGGFLVIGGKDQNQTDDSETDQVDGIAVFNVAVNGNNDQPSNLDFMSSTDQALTEVIFKNGTTWDGADLVIRNAFNGNTGNTSNNTNVENVDVNAFSGDFTIGLGDLVGSNTTGNAVAASVGGASAMMNVDTFTATGGGVITVNADITGDEKGNFTMSTGSAGDTITVDLDGDAVDKTGTSFNVASGAGNDTIEVEMDGKNDVSFQTMQQLDNLNISAGSGDDTVILDAYGTFDIDAGAGSDFVRINSTDENGNADKGEWAFGQDTGAQSFGSRVLVDATLTLSFAGFEQTVSLPTDANGNYIANQLDINAAIKNAIASNPELQRLLSVESDAASPDDDTSSTGTQELVITSTVGGLNNLFVKINQPAITVEKLSGYSATELTALRQGIIDTTATTSTDLGDAASIAAAMTTGNINANGVVGVDYHPQNNGGNSDDVTAINFSRIDMSSGDNDLVVLHSNDNSANTLEINGAFGKVSVVNFFNDAGTTVGNHHLDFTSILTNRVDPSVGNDNNTQSTVSLANTINLDTVAEANSVSVLGFTGNTGNANAVSWDQLSAANLVGALNGTAGAAILGDGSIDSTSLSAATSTAGGELIGTTQQHIVMVQNLSNPGEYKVFHLTSDETKANFNTDGVLLGTLDFGYSIGTNFNLAGNTVNTAGQLTSSLIAQLEEAADQLVNGTLTDTNGNSISEFNVDILDGTVTPDPVDPVDPVDPEPVEGTEVPVAFEGDFNAGTASVADIVTFDVSSARATDVNTQVNVFGFEVGVDTLQLDLNDGVTASTLAELVGQDDVIVQANPIAGETTVSFGADANGDIITLTLAGITDPSLVDIAVI